MALVTSGRSLYSGTSIAVHGGSRYEYADRRGLSHLVEHLMLYCNERYPTRTLFAEVLDQTVVDYDATTYLSTLSVSFEATRSSTLAAIDLIAEVVLRPIISREIINRELQRIVDEEVLDKDIIEPTVDELVESLIFQGDALAQPISGSPQHLAQLTVRDVEEWHHTIVRGNRMAIAVIGNFDPISVEKRIRQRFSRLPHGPLFVRPRFSGVQDAMRILISRQATGLVQIRIGFPTVGFRHPERFIVGLLNNHLGAEIRWSSRLAERLLGSGLSYIARSELWLYDDVGTLVISCDALPERLQKVLQTLGEELRTLRTEKLTRRAFDLALMSFKRGARERQFISISQARFFAHQLLATGDVVTSEQFAHELGNIRPADLLRVASQTLSLHRMNVVVFGSVPVDIDEQRVEALMLGHSSEGGDEGAAETSQEV